MRKLFAAALVCLLPVFVQAQAIDTETWPPATDFSQEVHFWTSDGILFDGIPDGEGFDFIDTLTILDGGDQTTEEVTIGGIPAVRATNIYMNVADEFYFVWPEEPVVDVLIQYFANAESVNDDVGFLIGQLGNQQGVGGYTFESVTDQWEWRLFRIENTENRLGDLIDPSAPGTTFGGVNGGTFRIERVNGLTVRAIAIGPQGVFGEPEDINQTGVVEFDPDQFDIAVEWDANAGITDGLDLFRETGGDQETIEVAAVGPAGDQRAAVRPALDQGTGGAEDIYVNWEILDERFGPSSQPSLRMKIVCEYYDDPALAGATFGPQAYASTAGDIAFVPEADRVTLEGSGQWREAVWYVPDVKLNGVNVPTQAGPRFVFSDAVHISRMRLGVIRTSGIYEGVDPIPDAYPFDPDPYGIYAELDLNAGLVDNLDMGGGGGDSEYFIEDGIGPANDQRRAVRPALGEGSPPFDRYMNFAILNEVFGPSSQPNARIKIAVEYYDDPALAGAVFGPEVYQSDQFGTLGFQFYPESSRQTLEGTGEWLTAAWEISDMNFTGVNVGPQGAARFWFSDEAAVYISRVRYGVIRPVGINAGVDPLEDVPLTDVADWGLY